MHFLSVTHLKSRKHAEPRSVNGLDAEYQPPETYFASVVDKFSTETTLESGMLCVRGLR